MQPMESLYIVTDLGREVFIWATTAAEARARLHAPTPSPSRPDVPAARARYHDADLTSVAMPALTRADLLTTQFAAAPHQPRPPFPAGLSPREVEVLHFVAAGLTNPNIAAQLSISPRTVDHHLTSIYGKLGVTSRAAAIRFALDHHLG